MIRVADGNPLKLINPTSETVYASLCFCFGSANEPEGKHGINHLLEHILVGMLERNLSSICHQVVCDGLSDIECLRIDVATVKTNTNLLLDAILALMETVELDQSIFQAEYPAILGAADLSLDSYELVLETSRNSVFAGTPYSHRPDGHRNEIETISIDDCNKIWQTVRKETKSILGLYGNIEDVGIKFEYGTKTTPKLVQLAKPQETETKSGIPGVECCYGSLSTGCDPDLLDFLGFVMGGSRFGLLYRNLREVTGLAYDTRALTNHFCAGSLVRMYFGIDDKSKLQKAISVLWETIGNFCFDMDLLNFHKESYKCKFQFDMDNPERFLAKTTYRKLISLETDPLRILEKIGKLDVQTANTIFHEVFDSQMFVLSKII